MRVAVICPLYNEEKNTPHLIESLLKQTRRPDEIILVDDGSRDKTAEICKKYSVQFPFIKYFHQTNRGPAAARNKAWKNTDAEICVFTDGDCVPDPAWIENLLKPFTEKGAGAAAGTYKTLNTGSLLARFIGLEIAWRYRRVKGTVDVHGSYNLAVKRKVLEEVGGFDETYPFPSGEDWDLSYKVSRRSPIHYVPEAVVGHYHPEDFWGYMANQKRRAYDRMRVYKEHPDKRGSDTYTGKIVKYQVLAAGASIPSVIFFMPLFRNSHFIPLALFFFLTAVSFIPFPYFLKRDPAVAFYGLPVQFCRNFAWFAGAMAGLFKFGIKLK